MNREEKSRSHRRDRRPDRGSRGDLRGRLPRHQRSPGGRAAREAARGRRQLPHRQEPPDENRRREGRRGTARSELLEGPTALTFVRGDTALAAKAISTFNREHEVLTYKGGFMDATSLDEDTFKSIARLPGARRAQRPVRRRRRQPADRPGPRPRLDDPGPGIQLGQIADQGLVTGEAPRSPGRGVLSRRRPRRRLPKTRPRRGEARG